MSNSSNLILTTYTVGPRLKPKLFNHSLNTACISRYCLVFAILTVSYDADQIISLGSVFIWTTPYGELMVSILTISFIFYNYYSCLVFLLPSFIFFFCQSLSSPPPLGIAGTSSSFSPPLFFQGELSRWHRKQLSRINELLNATSDQCEEEEHKDFILREFKCGKITIRAERCAGDDEELPACFDVLENSLV